MPRPPSPELRERIFRASLTAEANVHAGGVAKERGAIADFTRWLIPALGCFLLAAGTLTNRYSIYGPAGVSEVATNFHLGDRENGYGEVAIAARFEGAAGHSDINSLPASRLEWSFATRANVPDQVAPVFYTNTIIQ